ncbi:UNVERIFIED_CONTAM: hypothetical protein Slati_2211400 [Sesamum latifolium]|uniref:Reverse transcriptase n=1 Tax=Sesamum latifolium TaxID=2727402 RepID=A0AAW2WWK6_9LAMI
MCKVDLRKAYDTLEWNFVCASLRLFGFPMKFVEWIAECISTTTFSISINGELKRILSWSTGPSTGGPYVSLSVCTCHGGFTDATYAKEWSGLTANVQKSQLIVSKAAGALKQRLLQILGFQEGALPVRYLGLPYLLQKVDDDCADGDVCNYPLQLESNY